jgi:hypothetical protein
VTKKIRRSRLKVKEISGAQAHPLRTVAFRI